MSSLFTTRSLQANSAFTTRHLKDDSIVANTIITGDGQRVNVNDLLKGSDGYVTKDQMKKITNELQKNIQTNTKNIKANNTKISNNSKELQETNNKVQSFDSRISVNETDIDKLESDLTNHAENNHLNNNQTVSCYYNCTQNVLDTLGKSKSDYIYASSKNWISDAVKKSYAAYHGLDIDVKPKISDHEERITTLETDVDKLESDLTNHAKNNHLNNGHSVSCYYDCSQNVLDTLGKSKTYSHETYAINWINDAVKKSYAAYHGLDIDVKPKISDHETRITTLETDVEDLTLRVETLENNSGSSGSSGSNTDIELIKKGLSTVNTKVTTNTDNITAIDERLTALEQTGSTGQTQTFEYTTSQYGCANDMYGYKDYTQPSQTIVMTVPDALDAVQHNVDINREIISDHTSKIKTVQSDTSSISTLVGTKTNTAEDTVIYRQKRLISSMKYACAAIKLPFQQMLNESSLSDTTKDSITSALSYVDSIISEMTTFQNSWGVV